MNNKDVTIHSLAEESIDAMERFYEGEAKDYALKAVVKDYTPDETKELAKINNAKAETLRWAKKAINDAKRKYEDLVRQGKIK